MCLKLMFTRDIFTKEAEYSHRFQVKYLFGMRRSERTHDTCLMGRPGKGGTHMTVKLEMTQ